MSEINKSIIPEICNETTILIDNTKDISSLLYIWNEISTGLKEIEAVNEKIRTKIKNFLIERDWKHYNDEPTKISVSITEIETERIDKTQLKMMLTDSQYSQISNIKRFERLNIITPQRRKELNKIVR